MYIRTTVAKILSEIKDLKECYNLLKFHNDIDNATLLEAIYMLEMAVNELKGHPNTQKEISEN